MGWQLSSAGYPVVTATGPYDSRDAVLQAMQNGTYSDTSGANNGLGGDVGSTATGTSQPGVTNLITGATSGATPSTRSGSTPTDRGPGAGPGGTSGPGAGIGNDQGPPSNTGAEQARPGAWYGNLGDQLYGQTYDVSDPSSFWRDLVNGQMGIKGFSNTADWLSQVIGNPYDLASAMGNSNNMTSNFGALNAMTGIEDNVLGQRNMSFDPKALIGSVVDQVMSFDPNKLGPNGELNGMSMLGARLWNSDPIQMWNNISQFLIGSNGILKGIMPAQAFQGLQNIFSVIGSNLGAKYRQGGIEQSEGGAVGRDISSILKSAGVM